MAYKVIVSLRAQREIENAIGFYLLNSKEASLKFVKSLILSYNSLKTHPHYKVCYKHIRSLKIRRFPYTLYFVVDENKNLVKILSCFHNKRNPNNRPSLEK